MRTALKKHIRLSYTLIVIVFLVLSSVSSAATVLKNSFENYQLIYNSELLTAPEATEEASLQGSSYQTLDSDFPLRHASPNRLFKKDRNSIAFAYDWCLPIFSFVSYNLLLRPSYYHFLFRHNLF
jgi:hypothetical protein